MLETLSGGLVGCGFRVGWVWGVLLIRTWALVGLARLVGGEDEAVLYEMLRSNASLSAVTCTVAEPECRRCTWRRKTP